MIDIDVYLYVCRLAGAISFCTSVPVRIQMVIKIYRHNIDSETDLMIPNGTHILPKSYINDRKWPKMARDCWKCPLPGIARNCRDSRKRLNTAENGRGLPEMVGDWRKKPKMARKGHKWLEWFLILKLIRHSRFSYGQSIPVIIFYFQFCSFGVPIHFHYLPDEPNVRDIQAQSACALRFLINY